MPHYGLSAKIVWEVLRRYETTYTGPMFQRKTIAIPGVYVWFHVTYCSRQSPVVFLYANEWHDVTSLQQLAHAMLKIRERVL